MKLVIVDCGAGNLHSVEKAVHRATEKLACEINIVSDAESISSASHIILPGVGAFADCMQGLQALDGVIPALEDAVLAQKKPFLGICVGMQMLFESSNEHGTMQGLGWLRGHVRAIDNQSNRLKIPHMGWNELHYDQPNHPLLRDVPAGAHVYFVHSYHAECADVSDRLASVGYGAPLCAAVARENIMGTQFHPEKSQSAGLQLLKNFVQL